MGTYVLTYGGSAFDVEVNFRKLVDKTLTNGLSVITYGSMPTIGEASYVEPMFEEFACGKNKKIWDSVSFDVHYCKYRDIFYVNDVFIKVVTDKGGKNTNLDFMLTKLPPKLVFLKLFYHITKIYALKYIESEDLVPIIRFNGLKLYIRDAMYRFALNMRKFINLRNGTRDLPNVCSFRYAHGLYTYKPYLDESTGKASLFQKLLTSNNVEADRFVGKYIQKFLAEIPELTFTDGYSQSKLSYTMVKDFDIDFKLNGNIRDMSLLDVNVIKSIDMPESIYSNIDKMIDIFDVNYDRYELKAPAYYTPYVGIWFDDDSGENIIPTIVFPPTQKGRTYTLTEIFFNTFILNRYSDYCEDMLTNLQLCKILQSLQ